MSIRVFGWEDNPSIDRPRFKQSNIRAGEIVSSGRGAYITLPDGRRAVQLFPEKTEENSLAYLSRAAGGTFSGAWRIKPSGCMPVWQMQTQRYQVSE